MTFFFKIPDKQPPAVGNKIATTWAKVEFLVVWVFDPNSYG